MYRPPPNCQTKAKVRELSSNGVMDECSGNVRKRALTQPVCTNERCDQKVSEGASNGVMDECSGKIQKAGTHLSSCVAMYVAAVQLHVAAIDCDSSALPKREGTGHGKIIQRGDGCKL